MSIWDFPQIKSTLVAQDYITLGEGFTPIEYLNVYGAKVAIKREDDNPSGSYKDRGTAYKITQLKEQGVKKAVISSSGNAAISFLTYGNVAGIEITAIVSPHVNPLKLAKLQELARSNGHKIMINAKARQLAAQIYAETGAVNLKASTDPVMPIAYQSISFEVNAENFTDIFVSTSSGTALAGIAQALPHCHMHACQTTTVHAITGEVDQDYMYDEPESLADAITDKIALRKEQILKIIGSNGWVISNHQIQIAYDLANEQLSKPISYTSALALAGFIKAQERGRVGTKSLIIASGT